MNNQESLQGLGTKTVWFVNSGPDKSHLHDTVSFARLRDAKEYAELLPPTPTGAPRPYRIVRQELKGLGYDVD
jgi:hypothetical protein